jgi:hypothetical protein
MIGTINKSFTQTAGIAAAALLGATLGATVALTQTAPTQSASATSQLEKPSPYQGLSTPPSDDIITTSEEPPAQLPPAPARPVAQSKPAVSIVKAAPPASPVPAPELKARPSGAYDVTPADPDAEIVTSVPAPPNALPGGTVFRVHMLQEVMASDTAPGTPFRARLSQDLVHDGHIVVPMGSELLGKVIYTTYGRRISGQSVIHLRADEFILPDGTRYHLHAQVIDTLGSNTKPTGEGNIAYKSSGKRDLAVIAAGSGGGAIMGAALGGPAGAAVGTAVGAGIMGTHWLLANHSADLPLESTVVFSLTDPMFLTPTRD